MADRNTQTSLYKVLDNIDLSRNTLFNVTKIVGSQYENLDKDLEISSWDNASSESSAGNLILRSGVNSASGDSGSVRLFSGTMEDDNNRGITLNPNTSITIKATDSDNGDISLEANHQLYLRALENEITLTQVTENNTTYNTFTVDNSGTNKGKVDVTSDVINITSNSDLDISVDNGVYRVLVEDGTSTETVSTLNTNTLNVATKADINGVFDYDGTTFDVDATTKTTVNSKALELNTGYDSSSTDATLKITATAEESSITADNVTVDDTLDSKNITAENITASISLKSNTSLETQGSSTLKGTVSIEDTDPSTPGSLSVSSKTISLNNSSTTESTITVDSKTLNLDADSLTISSNNKNLLTATSSASTLSVDNVNATTQVNVGSGKLLLNLDGTDGVISANTKLVEKSKLLHLFSGYNSEDGEHALDLEVKVENSSYVSSLSIDSITSDSVGSDSITAETELISNTEFTSKGTSTLEGTVNIQNTSGTTTGTLNITSKEVSIDNHSTTESKVAINTATLDVDAATKTEDISGNSTTTVIGTLSETAGTLNLAGTSALSITANSKNLITANTSSSTATIDNITAGTQLSVTSGTVNVGTASNASTVTAAKSLDIVTPDLDITAGGNTILSGTSASSSLNVTSTTATTTTANDIQATETLLVGSNNTGLLIYWDNPSNSVVFARKG